MSKELADEFRALRAFNKDIRKAKEDNRIAFAVSELKKMGCDIKYHDDHYIDFIYKGAPIRFFPYSGWHTGKSIKDGRGWNNLKRQLKDTKP